MFWIGLLFVALLSGENPSPIAHFESGLPCIAGGYVNIITGAPSINVEDLVIPGIEPLSVGRTFHYDPIHARASDMSLGHSWNLDFEETLSRGRLDDDNDRDYWHFVDRQSMFSFEEKKEGKKKKVCFFDEKKGAKEKVLFFDVVKNGKGSTNLGHGYPTGRFALKNVHVSSNPPKGIEWSGAVLFGNGEKKKFWGEIDQYYGDGSAPLQEIETPNGFIKRFHWGLGYEEQKTRPNEVHGIELFSPSGHQIVKLDLHHNNCGNYHKVAAWAPDGRHMALTYAKKDRRRGQLLVVDSSDRPRIQYGYLPEKHNRRLETISSPENRGIKFSYWAEGDGWVGKDGRHGRLSNRAQLLFKVKAIEQPVGAKSDKVTTHLIQYFQDDRKELDWEQAHTRVISSYGHIDDYFYDKDFVIQEVAHFTNLVETERVDFPAFPLQVVCDLKEKFYWNEGGQIREKVQLDGTDLPLRSVAYGYDERGNVSKETFKGNLTGGLSDEETYTKTATYSDDDYNLLLSETLPNKLKVQYEYLKGTNLLTKRATFTTTEAVRTELFSYDDDHCLIRSEEISSGVHRVEKIKPSKVIPFGYPLEKEIYAGNALIEIYRYKYNNRGDVVFEERLDANGDLIFSIQRNFDPHGNCTSEADSLGRVITRTFDANDNCTQEVGPRLGFAKSMRYDWMNRCTQEIISFEGQAWITDHAYNHLSQRIKTTNYLRQETKTAFDRYGRPVQITLPSVATEKGLQSPIILKAYDPFGNEISSTNPLGDTTHKKFNAKDQLYQVIHPDGSKQTICYSIEGYPILVIDEDGVTTHYTYDLLGRVLSKTTPHGTELYQYRGLQLMNKIDMEGVSTTYRYDVLGRLIETKCGKRRETIEYDNLSHPYRKSHFEDSLLLSSDVSKVDPLGRTVETYLEGPSGTIYNRKTFKYDLAGNCVEEWSGDAKIERVFDGLNRVIYVKDHQGNEHRVIYSKLEHEGQLVEEKTVVDPKLQQVITLYNALGKETHIRHLDPFGQEVRRKEITYDLAGNVIKEETFSPTDQRTLLKEVDERGRVTALIEPLKKVTRMSYTKAGKLEILTKPDGIQLIHTYHKGRLSELVSSDQRLGYRYLYNKRGELTFVVDKITGKTSRQVFSPLGELLSETLPTGETMTYTYDGLGRMTSYSLPDSGKALLTYNARATTSIQRVDKEGTLLYQHAYTQFDNLGNVTEEQLIGKGGTVSYTFDSLYQIESIQHPYYSQKNLLYDRAGNLLSYEKNGEAFSFRYDPLYQLTSENEHTYTYDPFYNRTSKDEDPYEINELNQLLACSDTHYTYDQNGNLLQLQSPSQNLFFTYDPLNRLTSIDNGEESVTFTYDSFHRRLTRNGVPFHFCREQEIGFENTLRILGPGLGADIGAAIAIELDNIPYAPLHDHQGSIVGLISLNGDLTGSWSYTAYGELVGTCLSPWGFSSKRQEPLTGWICFGRRDYDPATGRWTTPDPLGFEAGPNLYTYVFNRPLTHRDPLGLKPDNAESNLYTREDTWFEGIREDVQHVLTSMVEGITLMDDHAYEFGGQDRVYDHEMYIYDLCDLEHLPPDSGVVIHVNGVGVSPEEFERNCAHLAGMGFNVVGIYNPYHGEGFVNFCRDAFRAYSGKEGYVSQKAIKDFQNSLDTIFSRAPKGTQFLLCPHSEGNILAIRALERYEGDLSRVGYLGVAPAKYLEKYAFADYAYLMTSLDLVPKFDFFGRRNTDPARIYIAATPLSELGGIDHAFTSKTIEPHLKRGIDNYFQTGRISFEKRN